MFATDDAPLMLKISSMGGVRDQKEVTGKKKKKLKELFSKMKRPTVG